MAKNLRFIWRTKYSTVHLDRPWFCVCVCVCRGVGGGKLITVDRVLVLRASLLKLAWCMVFAFVVCDFCLQSSGRHV